MHDMTAKKAALTAHRASIRISQALAQAVSDHGLAAPARRRATCRCFAFEYGDTGAGNDVGIAHNWAAFDAIKVVPRYGVRRHAAAGRGRTVRHAATRRRSASRRWAGPRWCGRAPICCMAKAAQRARVPYTLGVAGGATIEEAAQGRARCVLAAALSLLARRSQNRLRPDRARACRRRQSAGADARRAGAHHALARNLCRARRRIPSECAHDLRNAGAAEMAVGAAAQRLSALCHHPPICRRARKHQRGHPPSRARTWAARFPGKRSSATATAGKARWR